MLEALAQLVALFVDATPVVVVVIACFPSTSCCSCCLTGALVSLLAFPKDPHFSFLLEETDNSLVVPVPLVSGVVAAA